MAKGKIKPLIFASDFENTVDVTSIENKETRVWAAGICEIHSDETQLKVFNTIEEWFEFISNKDNVPSGSKIYFHNLAYDCQFILSYLNKIGYVYSEAHQKTGRPLLEHGYNVLGTEMGIYYQVSINFGESYCLIRDSLKLIPGTLAKIGKDLGCDEKYWKIEEEQDFYTAERDETHIITDEEYEYIKCDVMGLCQIMCKLEDMGLTNKLTSSAYALDQLIKFMYLDRNPDADTDEWNFMKKAKKYFRVVFPELKAEEDAFCRKAYKGGWCYNNTNGEIQNCKHWCYDVNSLFPSMQFGVLDPISGEEFGGRFPCGTPIYFKDKIPKKGTWIVHMKAMFIIKKDHLPFIQLKEGRGRLENEFITDSGEADEGGYMDLYLCEPDYKLFFRQYDVYDYEIIDGYVFSTTRDIFKSFVKHFYEGKEKAAREGNPTEKQRNKLVINGEYGKLSTKPHRPIVHYEFDDEGILHLRVHRNEEGKCDELDDSTGVYVPAGAYTTSWARYYVINKAQDIIDKYGMGAVCYSDTDSLHTTVECSEFLWVDKYAMGAWDAEENGTIEKARYVRQKTYIEVRYDGTQIVRACGLPEKCKKDLIKEHGLDLINFFDYDMEVTGKLMRKKVKGGVVLYESKFAIKRKK